MFILQRGLRGPLIAPAPHPVPVADFTTALGGALLRPVLFRMPALGLRLALGEAADPLLHLQRAVPVRAQIEGYRFRFPTLAEALADIF